MIHYANFLIDKNNRHTATIFQTRSLTKIQLNFKSLLFKTIQLFFNDDVFDHDILIT